jgi:alkylation response protein AidB-like acyl-CoA dehydrogenase
VWTSYAQIADWGICLARTDPEAPKHRGISYLVVGMHAEGVEVRPLVQLTGDAEFNEVFFTDVFVPADRLIGPLNEGWRVANSTLSHERGTNPRQLVIHLQLLEEMLMLAGREGAFDDPRLRQRLAQAYVEVRLFQLHNWRSVSRLARHEEPGPEGSALKLYWSEMSKRLHDVALAVLGPSAPLWGQWQRSWLYYQASSIWAGTNEIQRNVIGERVLGLPRS